MKHPVLILVVVNVGCHCPRPESQFLYGFLQQLEGFPRDAEDNLLYASVICRVVGQNQCGNSSTVHG